MVECSDGCCIMNVVANCSCSGGGWRLANAGSFATNLLSSIIHGYQTGMFIWQKNLRRGLESFFSSQLIKTPTHSELCEKLHIPDWQMPFNHTWEKPSSSAGPTRNFHPSKKAILTRQVSKSIHSATFLGAIEYSL